MSNQNRSFSSQKREKCQYCQSTYTGLEKNLHLDLCTTYKAQSKSKQQRAASGVRTSGYNPLTQPKPSHAYGGQQTGHPSTTQQQSGYFGSSSRQARFDALPIRAPVKPPQNPPSLKENFLRSKLVMEFGQENKNGHLNCFLNVCLQALWQFPKVRAELQFMMETLKFQGSDEVRPFVNSLLEFYDDLFAFDQAEFSPNVPVVNSNKVRAELFKLYYDQNEFVLNEKADAFEALDKILGIIHAWQKTYDQKGGAGANVSLSQGMRLLCDENQVCFIHASFGQSNITQELCECGQRGPVRYQDPNVFGFSINVVDALKTLALLQGSNKGFTQLSKEEANILATNQRLVDALKFLSQNERPGCAENQSLEERGHATKTITCVEKNPEVMIFNAAWNGEPLPSQILKFMVSIPERFQSTQIFDDNQEETYVLRGLFAYQGAHYLSFFRRLLIKITSLPIEDNHLYKTKEMLKGEINCQTEWTLFDDANVVHKGTWKDVIQQCVDLRTYPTVLFYEKLDPDEQLQPVDQLADKMILKMFEISQTQDIDFGDVGGGYDQDTYAQQVAAMQEFEKLKKKQDNPYLITISEEEHKVPPALQVPNFSISSEKAPTLDDIKKQYKQSGIYLYKCNKCDDGIFALHVEICLKPGCGNKNDFMQHTCTDSGMWSRCLKEIFAIKSWQFQTPLADISKQEEQKVPYMTETEIIDVSLNNQAVNSKPAWNLEANQKELNYDTGLTNTVLKEENLADQFRKPESLVQNQVFQREITDKTHTSKEEQRDQSFQYPVFEKIEQVQLLVQPNDALNQSRLTLNQFANPPVSQIHQIGANCDNLQLNRQDANKVRERLDETGATPNQTVTQVQDSQLENQGKVIQKDGDSDGVIEDKPSDRQQVNPQVIYQRLQVQVSPQLGSIQRHQEQQYIESSSMSESEPALSESANQKREEQVIAAQPPVYEQNIVQKEFQRPKTDLQTQQKKESIEDNEENFNDLVDAEPFKQDLSQSNVKVASRIIDKGQGRPFSQDMDLEIQKPPEEDVTMFKCPDCKDEYQETTEKCANCLLDAQFYMRAGYSVEALFVGVNQAQLAKIIEKNEYKRKLRSHNQKTVTYPNRSIQSDDKKKFLTQNANQHLDNNTKDASEENPFWQCCECKNKNSLQIIDWCSKCHKDTFDRFKKELPQPTTKQDQVTSQQSKTPQAQGWTCKKCNIRNYFADSKCVGCKITLQEQIKQEQETLKQRAAEQREQERIAQLCIKCGLRNKLASQEKCGTCFSDFYEKPKCILCGHFEQYKNYEHCTDCRSKNVYVNNREGQPDSGQKQSNELDLSKPRIDNLISDTHKQTEVVKRNQAQCFGCKNPRDGDDIMYCLSCLCQTCRTFKKTTDKEDCYNCFYKKEDERKKKEKQEKAQKAREQQLIASTCTECQGRKHPEQKLCTNCMKKQLVCSICRSTNQLSNKPQGLFCRACIANAALQAQASQQYQKQLQVNGRKVTIITQKCTVCKSKPIYQNRSRCQDCLKCPACNVGVVESEQQFCPRCIKKTEDRANRQRTCQKCRGEIFTDGNLCNECATHCTSCGLGRIIQNEYGTCKVCYDAKRQKTQQTQQNSLSQSITSSHSGSGNKDEQSNQPKQKPIMCPRCNKSIGKLFNPKLYADTSVVQCESCQLGSKFFQIKAHNQARFKQ